MAVKRVRIQPIQRRGRADAGAYEQDHSADKDDAPGVAEDRVEEIMAWEFLEPFGGGGHGDVEGGEDFHEAGAVEKGVKDAVVGLVERFPDEQDDQPGDDHGQHEDDAIEELPAFGANAVNGHGGEDTGPHFNEVGDQEDEYELEGGPEDAVVPDVLEVFESLEFFDGAAIPAVEGVFEGVVIGVVAEEDHGGDGGENEEQEDQVQPRALDERFCEPAPDAGGPCGPAWGSGLDGGHTGSGA